MAKPTADVQTALMLIGQAEALLAQAKQMLGGPTSTPFPWVLINRRAKNVFNKWALTNQQILAASNPPMVWPLSCEALVTLGSERLSRLDGIGASTLWDISNQLEKLGFKNWYKG